MRFMIIVKATAESESEAAPNTDEQVFADMAAYHEELQRAGALLDGSGLKPSSRGWRITWKDGRKSMVDGPFTETKELIAGFWLWQVASREEAIAWLKKAPFDGGAEIELRQVFESEDFGEALTPELREQEERLRAQSAKAAKK